VVGDNQRAGNGMGQIDIDPDTERMDDAATDAGLEAQAGRVTAERKKAKRDDEGPDHRQREADQPEGA